MENNIPEGMKKCTKCGEIKPATAEYFNRDRTKKDGVGSWCKECRSEYNREYNREYYQKNKDRVLEYSSEYRQKNRDRLLERKREYYQQNKDKIREYRQKKREEAKKALDKIESIPDNRE